MLLLFHPLLFAEKGQGDLDEVSGIVHNPATGEFLLVEDNSSLLSAWKPNHGIVWQEQAPAGDYEDVAVLESGEVVLLNTNGNLALRTAPEQWRKIKIPGLTRDDNCEGLAVDGKRLLIACKAETLTESFKVSVFVVFPALN